MRESLEIGDTFDGRSITSKKNSGSVSVLHAGIASVGIATIAVIVTYFTTSAYCQSPQGIRQKGVQGSKASKKQATIKAFSTSCILELTYGLSDVNYTTGNFNPYSYKRLLKCLDIVTECKAELHAELDVDETLTSEKSYWPKYWKNPESDITRVAEFKKRGLTPDSDVAALVKRVNRLPFVENLLRTSTNPWTTSNLGAALQMIHFIKTVLQKLNKKLTDMKRLADAGCGTGFIVALLALEVKPDAEVVCVEYMRWVHAIGKQLGQRGRLYDVNLDSEQAILSRISWVWGDAINMQNLKTKDSLGKFDLMIFGMSLPHGQLPPKVTAAIEDGGLLFGPQCISKETIAAYGSMYCVGQWRAYIKNGEAMDLVDVPFTIPSKFVLPSEAA